MRNAVRARSVHTAALLLGALAVNAVSVPLAAGSLAQTPSEDCTKTLTEQYGATEFSDVNDRFRNSRRSVYLDAKLKSGKTVRMRCMFRSGGVSEVQVYEEPGMGASRDWPTWGPADEYRVEQEETADTGPGSGSGDTEQAAAPAEPGQGTPSEQPAQSPDNEAAEQPADESADQPAGEAAEQSADDSAEQATEEQEPQFGVTKKAPTN